jgi:hypothetical protein
VTEMDSLGPHQHEVVPRWHRGCRRRPGPPSLERGSPGARDQHQSSLTDRITGCLLGRWLGHIESTVPGMMRGEAGPDRSTISAGRREPARTRTVRLGTRGRGPRRRTAAGPGERVGQDPLLDDHRNGVGHLGGPALTGTEGRTY